MCRVCECVCLCVWGGGYCLRIQLTSCINHNCFASFSRSACCVSICACVMCMRAYLCLLFLCVCVSVCSWERESASERDRQERQRELYLHANLKDSYTAHIILSTCSTKTPTLVTGDLQPSLCYCVTRLGAGTPCVTPNLGVSLPASSTRHSTSASLPPSGGFGLGLLKALA